MAEKNSGSAAEKYSATKFNKYIESLKTTCKDSKSDFIFNRLSKNPITAFMRKHKGNFGQTSTVESAKSKTEDDGDDSGSGASSAAKASTDVTKAELAQLEKALKENPEKFAVKFLDKAEDANIGTDAEREQLREDLLKWTNAEAHIYSIIAKTLEKATQFKTTEGAGRLQLEYLISTHKTINKKVGKTLKAIFNTFTYINTGGPDGNGEGLHAYYQRLKNLITDMGKAGVSRDEEEQLDAYVEGLKRAGLYVSELKMCEIAEKDLDETHAYLEKREDKTSIQLMYQHGMKTKDVSNLGADIGRGCQRRSKTKTTMQKLVLLRRVPIWGQMLS